MSRAARKQASQPASAEWSPPTSVVVFGETWLVELVDQDSLGEGLLGYSDFTTRTIRVLKSLVPSKMKDVYLHEVAHAEMWEDGAHDLLLHKFGDDAGVALVEMLVELRQRAKRRTE